MVLVRLTGTPKLENVRISARDMLEIDAQTIRATISLKQVVLISKVLFSRILYY